MKYAIETVSLDLRSKSDSGEIRITKTEMWQSHLAVRIVIERLVGET